MEEVDRKVDSGFESEGVEDDRSADVPEGVYVGPSVVVHQSDCHCGWSATDVRARLSKVRC